MTVLTAEITADSAADTEAAGARLGAALRVGDLLCLDGPLGAGKTVLVRGIAAGLGLDAAVVRSPTFVVHHVYGRPPRLHHADLFRLGAGADVGVLDFDWLLAQAPLVVEWGGLADLGPWRPVRMSIDIEAGERRQIAIQSPAPERLARALAS